MPSDKPDSPALAADRLTMRFGDRIAVDDVSFEVGYGEVFGFLGPNGAGKTTTLQPAPCVRPRKVSWLFRTTIRSVARFRSSPSLSQPLRARASMAAPIPARRPAAWYAISAATSASIEAAVCSAGVRGA